MFTTSTRSSATALALSVLATVCILGGIQSLATQPAADAVLSAHSVQTHVVSAPVAVQQQVKG